MSSFHRVELGEWGIGTLKALGESPLQPERRPKRGTRKALDRMQDQARVQLIGRHQGKPYYETLEVTSEEGLSRLPELDEGDVFFDIEGDAFVREGGLEYLLIPCHNNDYVPEPCSRLGAGQAARSRAQNVRGHESGFPCR